MEELPILQGLQLRSTLTPSGVVELELADVPVAAPREDEVVIRVEATPINPSDLMTLLGSADPRTARAGEGKVLIAFSKEPREPRTGRIGVPLPVGIEGAGTVVAAGAGAAHLLGARVAALTPERGMFAQYKTAKLHECVPLPGNASVRQCAGMFCNPLTALAIAETARIEGHTALVQTAAASNLGQMLVRICREDGVPLVNVVRREEQAELLRRIGADNIVNSSDPDFRRQLRAAIAATGATVAFDAIGGGSMAGELLQAFEDIAAARLREFSPYGSHEAKQVYIYGHLDPSPTVLQHENYGLLWDLRNWYMPATMARVGRKRAGELQQRAVRDIGTTFASHFSNEISLAQALDPEILREYSRMASGKKYLINPTL